MGRVYLARHQRMSRHFAIKVLLGDHAAQRKMRQRFAHEAEAAGRLSHRNLISVVDHGETSDGLLYLVMDHVPGRELSQIIADEAPLPADRVRRLLAQLCAGLAHAHDHGLIHRDFKGANVRVAGSGAGEVARIVDFGIAVASDASDTRLTTAGMVMGTPAYMSPEQATGRPLDRRSDLFSLGVVLYEMLSGVLPFDGTPMEQVGQNITCAPPVLQDRIPGLQVDGYLEHIMRGLMARDPDRRYQDAHMVITALESGAGTDALDTQPVPENERLCSPSGRRSPHHERLVQRAADRPQASSSDAVADEVDAMAATQFVRQVSGRKYRWLIPVVAGVVILGVALALLMPGSRERSGVAATVDAAPVKTDTARTPATSVLAASEGRPAQDDGGAPGQGLEGPRSSVPVPERAGRSSTGKPSGPDERASGGKGRSRRQSKGSREWRRGDAARPRSEPSPREGLEALHRKVGRVLDELAQVDARAATGFSRAYLDIQIHKAQRDPVMMREAFTRLRELERDIERALDGSSR